MTTNQLGWVKLPHIAALDLAIRERQRWTRDEREAAITSLEVVASTLSTRSSGAPSSWPSAMPISTCCAF
jgi:hypothetical protein